MWEIPSNKGKWHMRPASNILIFSLLQQQTLHSVQTNMMKHQLNVKQMKVLQIFLSTWFTDTVGWYYWKTLQLQQILKKILSTESKATETHTYIDIHIPKVNQKWLFFIVCRKVRGGVDSCKHMIPEISDLTRHAQKHQRDDPQTWISEMERLEVPIVVATAHKSAAGVCVWSAAIILTSWDEQAPRAATAVQEGDTVSWGLGLMGGCLIYQRYCKLHRKWSLLSGALQPRTTPLP